MNNDLISREALKKKLQSRYDNGYNIGIETAIDLIDNAPTVVVGYLTNCANCEKVEKLRAKRPQGEWKEIIRNEPDENGFNFAIVCSECGESNSHFTFNQFNEPYEQTFVRSKFCPNCGAVMKGANNG